METNSKVNDVMENEHVIPGTNIPLPGYFYTVSGGEGEDAGGSTDDAGGGGDAGGGDSFNISTLVGDDGNFNEGAHDSIRTALGEGYEEFKGFNDHQSPLAMIKGLADTTRKLHEKTDGTIKLLGEEPTEDEIKAYREAKQVPETPDKYEFTRRNLGKGEDGKDLEFDKEGEAMLRQWAFDNHKSPKELQSLITMYDKYEESLITRMAEAQVADAKVANEAFDKKHGDNVEKVRRLAGQAMEKTGFTENVLSKIQENYPGLKNDPVIVDWFVEHVVPKMLPGQHLEDSGGKDGDKTKKSLTDNYNHKTSEELRKNK